MIGLHNPKRRIMIIIAMIGSQRELNTTETTSTHILSLKPHTNHSNDWVTKRTQYNGNHKRTHTLSKTTYDNHQGFDSGETFHASIYNAIAYNIIKTRNPAILVSFYEGKGFLNVSPHHQNNVSAKELFFVHQSSNPHPRKYKGKAQPTNQFIFCDVLCTYVLILKSGDLIPRQKTN